MLGGTDTFPDGNAPEGDQGDTNVHLEGSYTWGGTVILDSFDGQGLASMEVVGPEGPSGFTETITSTGKLLTEQGAGDLRQIDFNIINNGTIDLAATHNDNNENNIITNNATMTVEGQLIGDELDTSGDNENPVINNNGTLDLGPNAALHVFQFDRVDHRPPRPDGRREPRQRRILYHPGGHDDLSQWPWHNLARRHLGPHLARRLFVADRGDPFTIVTASNVIRETTVTGTFTTVTGTQINPSDAFTVDYAASSVSLVVEAHTAPGGPPVLAQAT